MNGENGFVDIACRLKKNLTALLSTIADAQEMSDRLLSIRRIVEEAPKKTEVLLARLGEAQAYLNEALRDVTQASNLVKNEMHESFTDTEEEKQDG